MDTLPARLSLSEQAPHAGLDPDGRERVKVAVLRAAKELLSPFHLCILEMHLDGLSTVEIADRRGVGQPSTWRTLHGVILPKLAKALVKDPALMAEAAALNAADEPDSDDVARWFTGHLGKTEMFVSLTVLLIAHELADARREVGYGLLCQHVPRAAVTEAMSKLKYGGWIMTDGVTIRIMKTPNDKVPA